MELNDLRKLSGLNECGMSPLGLSTPSTPASISMTAASGSELSGMLKDIMSLAGMHKVEPGHLGAEPAPMKMTAEPVKAVGPAASDGEVMRGIADKLNLDKDDEEMKADESWDNEPASPQPEEAFDANQYAHHENPPGAAKGRNFKNNPVANVEDIAEQLFADYQNFIAENQINEASYVAHLRPIENAPDDVRDVFDLPVNSNDPKEAHKKFTNIFGRSIARYYEVVDIKSKNANKEVHNEIGETKKSDHNFTPEDIKELEKIEDLETLKARAFELISKPSAKPMKPEKVAWFKTRLESLDTIYSVIKLMYDLLLSGEGRGVIGSQGSMSRNSYRKKFGETDHNDDDFDDSDMSSDDDNNDDDEVGVENIVAQLNRAISAISLDSNRPVTFKNGEEKVLEPDEIVNFLEKYMSLKSNEKDEMQNRAIQSYDDFLAALNAPVNRPSIPKTKGVRPAGGFMNTAKTGEPGGTRGISGRPGLDPEGGWSKP
jgi:hypothetical protein